MSAISFGGRSLEQARRSPDLLPIPEVPAQNHNKCQVAPCDKCESSRSHRFQKDRLWIASVKREDLWWSMRLHFER